MSRWIPTHLHSNYSILDSNAKPKDIASRCVELEYSACAITDHGSISGAVEFVKELTKKGVKSILGCEFYLSKFDSIIKTQENRSLSHLVVLAKNQAGWKDLISLVSDSNQPTNLYYKPRLDRSKFAGRTKNLISFSGHLGSELANSIFVDYKSAYNARTYEDAKILVDPDWQEKTVRLANEYREIFGKDQFFLEIQLIDQDSLPAQKIVSQGLRYIAKKYGFRCVATGDSHYCKQEDADDQRVLLCTLLESTLSTVKRKIEKNEEVGLGGFFKSRQYHIPSLEEMSILHTEEELANSVLISDMCEDYSILGASILPKFPGIDDQNEALTNLCRDGWRKNIQDKIPKTKHQEYADRIKRELAVIKEANLAGYFLIVADYVNHFRNKYLVGPARGSAAGSLVSALVGITEMVDPIKYDLIFERFYNAGRNTSDRVTMPDIDVDFPVTKRDEVIQYIKDKYGHNKVAQICTFSKMMGRGALKDVLRVHEACSFEEMNQITEFIPDEAEISDQLQLMVEQTGESSIIRWALENNSKELSEWCHLKDDGSLDGKFAHHFAQAIRLEGTKRSQGKHAAGIVISSADLTEMCPMLYDKHGHCMITGMDMNSLKDMGHVKFDILGVASLDKIMGVKELLATGKISAI